MKIKPVLGLDFFVFTSPTLLFDKINIILYNINVEVKLYWT